MKNESNQFDLEQEARERRSTKEYFYCESLGKYIGRDPLKVSPSVVKAAAEAGIDLEWDDEGHIKDITYLNTKKLTQALGIELLTPNEFWIAYQEAREKGLKEVQEQLTDSQSTEWLDVVYHRDEVGHVFMIEHPEIEEDENGIWYRGKTVEVKMPEGRPGWFDPTGNIDPSTGFPIELKSIKNRSHQDSDLWKYWSVFKVGEPVSAIRGYVTSSGTPSLDLDIPVTAKQPVLMLRECRSYLPEGVLDLESIKMAEKFKSLYQLIVVEEPGEQNQEQLEQFYSHRNEIYEFVRDYAKVFINKNEAQAVSYKELIIDLLGTISYLAKQKGDHEALSEFNKLSKEIFNPKENSGTYESLMEFANNLHENLSDALRTKKPIVFVMGHKNPDTDTAVSSLMEAYRNQMIDDGSVYIPILQAKRVPDEIERLLGDQISSRIILETNPLYTEAKNSGQARWILVDQNVSDVQRFAIGIIDHHILDEKVKTSDIPLTWEMAGSATSLIAQKMEGVGISSDQSLSKILYGGTLMDSENRSDKKMTSRDKIIMNQLKESAEVYDDNEFFQDLMSYLLNTDDGERLFNRDYKEDWGIFGFAVAKIKRAFAESGEPIKQDLLDELVALAKENNQQKHFPLTIVKVVDYEENNEVVNKERVYLIFGPNASGEFQETLTDFIVTVIKKEFGDKVQIEAKENYIDFWGTGDQLSRKVTAPFLEPIVNAFNEFFYSEENDLFIKREFLKINEVEEIKDELDFQLSSDSQGRVNNIDFSSAKQLAEKLGYQIMSLKEFWRVFKEADALHDQQLKRHLQLPGFVEYLDTVVLGRNAIINHPKVENGQYLGESLPVNIPVAEPGLINIENIDSETGFPTEVQGPGEYTDKTLWRYWSPDEDVCIPTRGHIFLLNQCAFDNKIHPDEALPNLGIRPCAKKISPPKLKIDDSGKTVRVEIIEHSKPID